VLCHVGYEISMLPLLPLPSQISISIVYLDAPPFGLSTQDTRRCTHVECGGALHIALGCAWFGSAGRGNCREEDVDPGGIRTGRLRSFTGRLRQAWTAGRRREGRRRGCGSRWQSALPWRGERDAPSDDSGHRRGWGARAGMGILLESAAGRLVSFLRGAGVGGATAATVSVWPPWGLVDTRDGVPAGMPWRPDAMRNGEVLRLSMRLRGARSKYSHGVGCRWPFPPARCPAACALALPRRAHR
jgi:hypothetical protein